MNIDLNKKLNNFKKIKASNDWKADLKSELFQKEETHFLLQIVQPKLAFGSFAMAGLVLALVFIVGANQYPEVQMVENKIDHRVMTAVRNMQKDQDQDEAGLMAMDEVELEDEDPMTASLNFEDLPEETQRQIVRHSAEELLAELDEVEKRIVRVLGSR